MSLKKSDKIIAIVGVLILIVAAVGIVLYTQEGEEETTPEPTIKKYEVEWVSVEKTMSVTGNAGKKQTYTEPFTVSGIESGSVITNVDVTVVWEDDFTKGMLLNKGEDTLTAIISLKEIVKPLEDTAEAKTHKSTGSGNETLSFTINSDPEGTIIEDAEDVSEAEQKIMGQYTGKDSATFYVDVTVKTGEKILSIRPIKLLNYFRDRGNDFTFEITYEYCYPVVTEVGSEKQPSEIEEESIQTWAVMALPGKN